MMAKKEIKYDLTTKELLIKSAIQIISEKGYSKTTLEDIVRNVNLTRGAFYWYFKNKKEILSEIEKKYEENYRRVYGEFLIFESAYQTLYEMLKQLINKIFNQDYLDTAMLIRYKMETTTESVYLYKKQKQINETTINRIHEQLQRGIEQKELKQDLNPRETALYIFSCIIGVESMKMMHGDNEKIFEDFTIEKYVDNILSSLRL